jgi:hypothetical protein
LHKTKIFPRKGTHSFHKTPNFHPFTSKNAKYRWTFWCPGSDVSIMRQAPSVNTTPPHSPNYGGTYGCTRISKWPPFVGNMGDDNPFVGNMGDDNPHVRHKGDLTYYPLYITLFSGVIAKMFPFSLFLRKFLRILKLKKYPVFANHLVRVFGSLGHL